MIERLKESGEKGIGFKVTGRVTAEEVEAFLPQIEFAIKDRGKRTIGILADLSAMQGERVARQKVEDFSPKFRGLLPRSMSTRSSGF